MYCEVQVATTPFTTNFDSLSLPRPRVGGTFFKKKITAKDDLTISCSQFLEEQEFYQTEKIMQGLKHLKQYR